MILNFQKKQILIFSTILNILMIALIIVYFLISLNSCSPNNYSNEIKTNKIILTPDKLKRTGDVTAIDNVDTNCTKDWLKDTPIGSIVLGVDPTSCEYADWDGGEIEADIFLENLYFPTVYVLKISWPEKDGKGLHSQIKNKTAEILLDRNIIWSKSTKKFSECGGYYAAEYEPVQTTIVIIKSDTHKLAISVPSQTAWDISNIELSPHPYPDIIKGIGYSPYRDCQYPGGIDENSQPSLKDIENDLFRLSHTCTAIRTYGSQGINGKIPEIAKKFGLKVYAGAWIDGNIIKTGNDNKEMDALIDIANSVDIDGIIVGNEYCLRDTSAKKTDYLLKCIRHVQDGINGKNIPITTAEVIGLIFDWNGNEPKIKPEYQIIIDNIDFLLIHIYPFWDGKSIKGAANYTVEHYNSVKKLIEETYPNENKYVIIGETGWPSDGRPNCKAIPSPLNQQLYMIELMTLADQHNVDYMYFDAFDELWKIEEPGGVGQHWGYCYSDRSAKYNFHGVLLPVIKLPSFQSIAIETSLATFTYSDKQINYFPVYTEWPVDIGYLTNPHYTNPPDSLKFPFYYPAGFMGDVENIKINCCDRNNLHNGNMATQIIFSFDGENGWGGIYWLPDGKWEGPGINLYKRLKSNKGARIKLKFWARGEKGGERVQFKIGGVNNGDDSIEFAISTGWITLNNIWKKYEINLFNQKLSNIVGGVCWITNRSQNPYRDSIKIFIDDIKYVLQTN